MATATALAILIVAQVVGPNEIIYMQNQGVRPRVLETAQRIPGPVVARPGPPMVVADPYYGPPCYYYPRYYYRPPPPVIGFGFSYHR